MRVTDKSIYIENYLKEDLDMVKDSAMKGMSPVCCVDGYEQTCKSTLAAQIAYYLDPSVSGDLVRCAFTRDQTEDAIKKARSLGGDGRVVVLDEAGNIFDADETRSYNARWIKKVFQMCGKYHIIFIMCTPSLFDLSPYARIHRVNFLLRTYTKVLKSSDRKFIEKGYYMMFPMSKKIELLMTAKYKYDYSRVRPEYVGRFFDGPSKEDIWGGGYEKKKDVSFNELFGKGVVSKFDEKLVLASKLAGFRGEKWSNYCIAKVLGYKDETSVSALLNTAAKRGFYKKGVGYTGVSSMSDEYVDGVDKSGDDDDVVVT